MEYDQLDNPPPRKKKKRRTFKRIVRGFGRWLANMPGQTLIFIGGGIVLLLAAIILLVIFLPKNQENNMQSDLTEGNQLTITDAATPSPTLQPLTTPDPGAIVEPSTTPGLVLETALELNSEADIVADIQRRLVELGFMEEPEGGYTTKFAKATKNGIRRFQMRNFDSNKDWDGICGQKTLDLLMSDQAKGFFYKAGDTDEVLYDLIDGVGRVTYLQNRLIELKYMTGSATGTYGPTTETAISEFQLYHGLLPDGKAGQATLDLLFGGQALDYDAAKLRGTPVPSTSPDAGAATTGAETTGTDTTGATAPDAGIITPDPAGTTAG